MAETAEAAGIVTPGGDVSEPAAGERLVVHLVHGTWPEGPWQTLKRRVRRSLPYSDIEGTRCWFQRGHAFRTALVKGLEARGFAPEVNAFIWSGANSFRERQRAAQELVPHIARHMGTPVRQLVIGHSHGGTVAMLAMKMMRAGLPVGAHKVGGLLIWAPMQRRSGREQLFDKNDFTAVPRASVQAGVEQLELVTLATPFMRVEPFGSRALLGGVFNFCFIVLVAAMCVFAARRYGQEAVYPMLFGGGVALALAFRAVARIRTFVDRRIVRRQATEFLGRRLHCIRGISDEAGMAINLGIIGCNLTRTLLVGLGRLLAMAPVSLALLAYAGSIGVMTYGLFADTNDPVLAWTYRAAIAAGMLLLLLIVPSLLQGGLGGELAGAGMSFLTTVESAPDAPPGGIEVATLVSAKDTVESMRHAVYLHPRCVDIILERVALAPVAPVDLV